MSTHDSLLRRLRKWCAKPFIFEVVQQVVRDMRALEASPPEERTPTGQPLTVEQAVHIVVEESGCIPEHGFARRVNEVMRQSSQPLPRMQSIRSIRPAQRRVLSPPSVPRQVPIRRIIVAEHVEIQPHAPRRPSQPLPPPRIAPPMPVWRKVEDAGPVEEAKTETHALDELTRLAAQPPDEHTAKVSAVMPERVAERLTRKARRS